LKTKNILRRRKVASISFGGENSVMKKEKKYDSDSYKEPFWAENSGFMTGRDPLGVQNSSITTYGKLLPGMTNLTLRLRYYGFYMWVLEEFFKKQGGSEEFTQREQHNFVRRAELIIAFIMRHLDAEEQSIIGSKFTDSPDEKIAKDSYYSIAKGADKTDNTKKGSVYWDYPSGALGQYYGGSLSILKLISIDKKFFTIEDKGKKLAQAFRKSLKSGQESLFLKSIDKGKLFYKDIPNLYSFKVNAIEVDSEEWNYYITMLIENDGDDINDSEKNITYLRKQTIGLLLNYLSTADEDYDERSFILNEFLKNSNKLQNGSSFGWYYYYVNEAFHYALETIFWGILVKLDGKPMAVNEFNDELISKIVQEVEKKDLYKPNSNIEDVMLELDSIQIYKALEVLYNSSDSENVKVITDALELMLIIYIKNYLHLDRFEDFENKYYITGQKGRVSENFHVYIHSKLQMTFKDFAQNTIKLLLNDHVHTAYRKMGNGESNLLKFIIEDGVIAHVQTMEPKHTSPRLKTITNFLKDLSLVGTDNIITDKGSKFLKTISL